MYSEEGNQETFDFLIWAGLPSDFPDILPSSQMKNYLLELFKTQFSNQANVFLLSMKGYAPTSPMQIYAQQMNSDLYENGVMVNGDSYAYSNVSLISVY